MDFVSHALVGALLLGRGRQPRREQALVVGAAVVPDLPCVPVYLLVGHDRGRPLWIPRHDDWDGVRAAHPGWSALWEVPHSVLFLAAVVVPLVLLLRLPRLVVAAYASHLAIDLFSHTGEWAVRPLYPWGPAVSGFTDGWRWPVAGMAAAWAVGIAALVLVRRRKG